MSGRIVVLEFNELSSDLLSRFMAEGILPNFSRLHAASEVFLTDASSEVNLEPWVQWPTLHSGIPDREHGITRLGESRRLGERGIAAEVAAHGGHVGIFGSMNVAGGPLPGFVLPDPWNADARPHPERLVPFFEFVVEAVQESSKNRFPKGKALSFATFLVRNGVRPATAVSVVRQLVGELRGKGTAWRRSMMLDQVAFDVFCHLVRRHDVTFGTFFSNSTAHFQHYYWRNYDPGLFSEAEPSGPNPGLGDAIPSGYRAMDRLVGQALKELPGHRLVFATGLSQEAWDTSKCTYRPVDAQQFLFSFVGLDPGAVTIEPIMAEQYLLSFASEGARFEALDRLRVPRLGDGPLLEIAEAGDRLKIGCRYTEPDYPAAEVTGPNGTARRFDELFFRIHGVRSGRHHPEGSMWIQSTTPRVHTEPIPLTAVAPGLLRLLGTEVPSYMKDAPFTLNGAQVRPG